MIHCPSSLKQPLVPLQDTAEPHKLLSQITAETARSLWSDVRSCRTRLDFILAKQCRTTAGDIILLTASMTQRVTESERTIFVLSRHRYVSIWAKFITFIMGFSREDLLL